MRTDKYWMMILVLSTAAKIGCGTGRENSPSIVNKNPPTAVKDQKESKIEAALAGLSEQDRTLATAQRTCPIHAGSRLGSMGRPVKLVIEGQPVFLCCPGCEEEALKHPKETLVKLTRLNQ